MIADSLALLRWGPNFGATARLAYRFDSLITYPLPREGSKLSRSRGGAVEATLTGTDWILEADVKWVPDRDLTSPAQTGWQSGGGWQGIIAWAQNGGTVRLIPDTALPKIWIDAELVAPTTDPPSINGDATQSVHLKLRALTPFDPALAGLLLHVQPAAPLAAVGGTFIRGSVATYLGADGFLKTALPGEIRVQGIDQNNDGDWSEGLEWLLEPAGTNACLFPEDLTNAAWTNINTAVAANAITGPDGLTSTADKLTETAVNAAHLRSQDVVITAGEYCSWSFFVRAAERSKVFLHVDNVADRFGATFDLTTGAIAASNTGAGILAQSRARRLSRNWWRISIVGRVNAGATNVTAALRLLDNAGSASYLGVAGSGVYAFGGQFERVRYCSSYMPAGNRAGEFLQFGLLNPPQALWGYLRMIVPDANEAGGTGAAMIIGGDAALEDGADKLELYYPTLGGAYRIRHAQSAANVDSTLAVTPAAGDQVELFFTMDANGAVKIEQSLNGAATTAGATSGNQALQPRWGLALITLSRYLGGNGPIPVGVQAVKLGGGSAVTTLAQARAA